MQTPPLTGILETALYVRDLEAAKAFYERVLGFVEILREEGRLIGMRVQNEKQVLLLFREGASTEATETPGGTIPPHDGHGDLHLAFGVSEETLPQWREHLARENVVIESENAVPERGGTSLYFRDGDNHLVELAPPRIWPGF